LPILNFRLTITKAEEHLVQLGQDNSSSDSTTNLKQSKTISKFNKIRTSIDLKNHFKSKNVSNIRLFLPLKLCI
jgi:hypothetical protein